MQTHTQSNRASAFHLQNWTAKEDGVAIDSSLARGVRRAYFKRLYAHYQTYLERVHNAHQRNQSPFSKIKNDKQLRERMALTEKLLGPFLPVYVTQCFTSSRSAAAILFLNPDEVPEMPQVNSDACVDALCFTRPGRLMHFEMHIKIRAHVIDRIIQRAGVVDLPIRRPDIEAIHAEISDLLPLSVLAVRVLSRIVSEQGDREAERLMILIPNEHGVFLGRWSAAERKLVLQTFVDEHKLNQAQRMAVAKIQAIPEADLSTQLMTALVPGWTFSGQEVLTHLEQTWREFGWMFAEERLHPGLSDKAWLLH